MSGFPFFTPWAYLGVFWAAAFWAAPWLARAGQPLTFERPKPGQQSAPENLRATRRRWHQAQQAVGPAGRLPDPQADIGIDKLRSIRP